MPGGGEKERLTKVRWPLLRISSRLVVALYESLLANKAAGHEEIVTAALCDLKLAKPTAASGRPCTLADHAHDGAYALGGWGPFKRRKQQSLQYLLNLSFPLPTSTVRDSSAQRRVQLQRSYLRPQRVYHPAKCDGDPSLGERALACSRHALQWAPPGRRETEDGNDGSRQAACLRL